jgi:hypothetical protein
MPKNEAPAAEAVDDRIPRKDIWALILKPVHHFEQSSSPV